MKTLLVFILAFTAWAQPLHAASALEQNHHDEAIFINYEQFHKQSVPSRQSSNRGQPSKNAPVQLVSTTHSGRNYTKEEVIQLIRDYSAIYKINSDTPLCIAKLESGYNQFSKNKSSSASGVFQYLANSTWKATDEGRAGLSVFDADANVRAAVKYMAIHKRTTPWVVHTQCPPLKFL